VNPTGPLLRTGVAFGLALLAGVLADAQAASAQWRPARPDDPVRVEAWQGEAGIRVRLAVDDGWYVYGVDAEGIGLPLQVLPAEGDEPLGLSTVDPPETTIVEGRRVPIHRGRADFLADAPPGNVAGAVRVRWAACRGDLCIPRESRAGLGGRLDGVKAPSVGPDEFEPDSSDLKASPPSVKLGGTGELDRRPCQPIHPPSRWSSTDDEEGS
jgi:hypothetical protein